MKDTTQKILHVSTQVREVIKQIIEYFAAIVRDKGLILNWNHQ